MRNITKYTLICGCILALSSCQEKQLDPVPGDGTLLSEIGLTASAPATKGLIDDIDNAKTRIKVFDFLSGSTETGTAEVKYIDDVIKWKDADTDPWDYAAENTHYHWTKTGTHKFFGWLTTAPDGTAFDTAPTWTENTKTLSIRALTMTPASTQFDFVYSNIITRTMNNSAADDHSLVKLEFSHLFSALAMNLENIGEDEITVQSVSIAGVNNTKSATIGFGNDTPALNYADMAGSNFLTTTIQNPALAQNNKIDLYTGATWTQDNPILMWPQTASEIAAAEVTLSYTIAGYEDPDNPGELMVITKTVRLNESGLFGDKGMEAGKKYIITLRFKGKTIDLNLVVMPWDYQEFDLEYSSSTISANAASGVPNEGVLWLYTWTYDEEHSVWSWSAGDRNTRSVTMESGNNVRGIFYIGAPHSGRWQITTYPAEAAQYFSVEPSSGVIDEELIKDHQGLVEFYVKPKGAVPTQQILHFNIAFQFNGETQWRDGNTEFNRKDWKIVREP